MALKGIPYWGESTFADMREIADDWQSEIIKPFDFMLFEADGCKKDTDLYSIFYNLAFLGYIFLIPVSKNEIFYSWCTDIRFNYRDKVIFIPYYSYEEYECLTRMEHKHLDKVGPDTVLLKHNFQLHSYPLLIGETYKNMCIYCFHPEDLIIYQLDLNNAPYIKSDFSISELYGYYKEASYYDEAWDAIDFTNKYHWIEKEKGLNVEHQIRGRHKLQTYKLGRGVVGTDTCIKLNNYVDIRLYDLYTIRSQFDFVLREDLQYWERKYNFEAYLLLHNLMNHTFVETKWGNQYKKLGVTESFLKYEEDVNKFPMYLKHYYRLNDNIGKKTYERYMSDLSFNTFTKEC